MEGKSFHTTLCLILVLLGMTTSHPADDNSSGVKYPDCWLTKNECEFIHRTLFHVVKKNACQYWCSCQGFDVGECFLSETSMYKTPPHAPCWECNCSGRTMLPLPQFCFA